MGFFKRLFGMLGSSQKCSILIVGLDDAGKTTIMNQIMPSKVRPQAAVTLGSPYVKVAAAVAVLGSGSYGWLQGRAVFEEQYRVYNV